MRRVGVGLTNLRESTYQTTKKSDPRRGWESQIFEREVAGRPSRCGKIRTGLRENGHLQLHLDFCQGICKTDERRVRSSGEEAEHLNHARNSRKTRMNER
jgi:hypothetical protein